MRVRSLIMKAIGDGEIILFNANGGGAAVAVDGLVVCKYRKIIRV